MCFGSKSSNNSTPAPSPPTTFQAMPADTSNTQQRKAAVLSSTEQPAALGSELGGATAPATGSTSTMGGM